MRRRKLALMTSYTSEKKEHHRKSVMNKRQRPEVRGERLNKPGNIWNKTRIKQTKSVHRFVFRAFHSPVICHNFVGVFHPYIHYLPL